MLKVLKFSSETEASASDFSANYRLGSAFQPIFSPTHQRLVGYEALARAKNQGQDVSPKALLEQARIENRTETLDRQLLQHHIGNFASYDRPVWLFLNITPATCIHPDDSLNELAAQCALNGIEPDRVVLEVVETAATNDPALLRFVREAKQRGFQIAIDDFGVDDSNFERMWRLEPLIVKLDRSLLVNAQNHSHARRLLESLVKMIRESGSLVLLEGIENERQAAIALATEADLLQGFLFGRPGPLDKSVIKPAETGFITNLARARENSREDFENHETYLQLVRTGISAACRDIAGQQGFREACEKLLGIKGIKRCFLLNEQGVQQGGSVSDYQEKKQSVFNPLYFSSGACWAHREYFRSALRHPDSLSISRPYVALPDAVRTITLSTLLDLDGHRRVFCVDLHPDAIFDGQLSFPAML
ncbi:MAG: EAL domain-containing protein [Oleiphilaceae bacterium]|nr:EAL domain-containing protein [Oleiphilaceae bacterium]